PRCDFLGYPLSRPVAQHRFFNVFDRQVGQVADAFLAASTLEVEVLDAASPGGLGEDEAADPAFLVAAVAPHSALEVVIVDSATLTAHAAGVKDGLHPVKQLPADERWVTPR